MGANWQRRGAHGMAVGTVAVVLAAAAAVLVASASGALGPRVAQAAPAAPAGQGQLAQATAHRAVLAGTRRRYRTRITHLPLTVADGTRGVAIRLNDDPAISTPRPQLRPHTAGTWTNLGNYEFFHPVSTLEPCTTYTMRIPAGTLASGHRRLGHTRKITFKVACPGITAVQEALARLNYLPYTLHGFVGASSTAGMTRAQAARRAFVLPHGGVLIANVRDAPPLDVGTLDPTTTGALEVYEEDHNLPIGTTLTPTLWRDLLADETIAGRNPHPYTWVTVTETLPETLEVHQNNKVVLTTPVNTGVPGATTQTGVFPIYVRYVSTTMVGTDPDGVHYVAPDVPWVNYFNGGDAVHGYPRASYGFPQSNGCVELPIATAQTVYGMLAVGDLVIVE